MQKKILNLYFKTFIIFSFLFGVRAIYHNLIIKENSNNQNFPEKLVTPTEQLAKESNIETLQTKVSYNNLYYHLNDIIIVNANFPLSAEYNPGTNKVANEAFLKMQKAAANENLTILPISIFRSYDEQAKLFASYAVNDVKAENYSAKAGESEHQTGLAFDVKNLDSKTDLEISFGNTPEGKWLKQNCDKFGFIIRYLEGKEAITGKQYEPWHIRYVGTKIAQKINSENLTLEEYLLQYE